MTSKVEMALGHRLHAGAQVNMEAKGRTEFVQAWIIQSPGTFYDISVSVYYSNATYSTKTRTLKKTD